MVYRPGACSAEPANSVGERIDMSESQALQDLSFSQSAINTYVLYNQNYNVIPVKIRLKGANDPGAINLSPGNKLLFEIRYSSGQAKFYYTGKEVQQIDLNNGNDSDDLNTPTSDNNKYNTLRYRQGQLAPNSEEDVINFNSNTYVRSFGDIDGVDGGPGAMFTQTIQGS